MLDALIRLSIRNRHLVVVSAALALIAGVYVAVRMPVDVFPDLTAPTVTVLTDAHGMAPEEVESLVTRTVEASLNGATGVRRIRSSTAQGISIVWADFDWGTDVYRARQVVGEKLQVVSSQLPDEVDPPILAPITSIMGEIMLVAVTGGAEASEMEMRTTADWVVRRRLLAVPGVAQVLPLGGEVRQYQVQVDPATLEAYDLSLSQVLDAARMSNQNASGGVFRSQGTEYVIRGIGRIQILEDLEQTVVTVRDGTPVLLGQVADVRIGAAPRMGAGSVNAERAVVVAIQKQPDVNTLELTDRLDQALAEIEETLPAGIGIDRGVFRQADFIGLAIDNLRTALRDGAILVVLILFLFLWSARTTLISVLAIPLSLVVAVFALAALGITLNTMTLGGMAIAVGALVDDAVIDVENVFRRLRENRALPPDEQRPVLEVVFDASKEIRASIAIATFIIAVVFVPLFFLSGLEGRMLRPLGIAYIIAILASLLVAVTVTPALSAILLPGSPKIRDEEEGAVVRGLQRGYAWILGPALRAPRTVLLGAGLLVAAGVASVPFLGQAFLPDFNEGTLVVSAVHLPGTSLDEADVMGRRLEEILLEHPAVTSTSRRTGRAELDEHAQDVNAAEIDADLDLTDREMETVLEELRASLTAVPGTQITIGQPIMHRIDHMLSGTRAAIAMDLYGPDLGVLRSTAEQIRAVAEGVEGAVEVSVEQQANVPQVVIDMNRPAMARYGMTPGAMAEAVDVAFAGETVSRVLEGQRSFDLAVRLNEESRKDLEAIRSARIRTPTGSYVAMGDLADVRLDRGPNRIARQNVQRKITIQANVSGRDVTSVVEDMQAAVAGGVELPDGYFVEYGGQFESARTATRRILLLSLVSLFAILLLLFVEFRSVRQSLLVMVNLPLALVGGVIAVLLTGGVLNIASLVGFITLFGIAVRNGILLVSRYNDLLDEGVELADAVWKGSMERLSPISMTALTAGLALLPLALERGEPGNEIQGPLAVVVLGGLLTALVLNMVVVPVLYRYWGVREQA